MRAMNKKVTIPACSTLIFAITTGYFLVQFIHFKELDRCMIGTNLVPLLTGPVGG
jgi:hypothetical protein